MYRTMVIGDIHGDIEHLERLLAKLPPIEPDDTVVFLGDYVDRGPSSRQVVERVRRFKAACLGKCVLLRGNHEDAWIESYEKPNYGFLLPPTNGCYATMTSFVDCEGMDPQDAAARLINPRDWFPEDLYAWMKALPTWYEDDHAIYVHAGLERRDGKWLHPSEGRAKDLMWARDPDFWMDYEGKTIVFGHTCTVELPVDHLNWFQTIFDDKADVWFRNDLIGLDTACGKGGFLSSVVMPSKKVLESRR